MLCKYLMDGLYECLTKGDITTFAEEGELYHSKTDHSEQYVFKDGGENAKILAVAHTDWVKYHTPKLSLDGTHVKCGQLDDRLGVWVIMYLLKQILPPSMPYDILLTDQEETGNSTAKLFYPEIHGSKTYNWMFEFDRRGSDVVMYDYETPTLVKTLRQYGLGTAQGSFSDICYLSHLKCVGINVGTCYYGEHTDKCYANLNDLLANVYMFAEFYKEHYKHKFRHNSKKANKTKDRKINGKSYWDNYSTPEYQPGLYLPAPKKVYNAGYQSHVIEPRNRDNMEDYLTDKEIAQLSVDLGVTEQEAELLYYDRDRTNGLTDFEQDIIKDLRNEVSNKSIVGMSDEEFTDFQRNFQEM